MTGAARSALMLLACLAGATVHADDSAERDRIRLERDAAQARYAKEERACKAQFAVTACEDQARARRRETLADLRRQEVSLNDARRMQQAAERSRARDERLSGEHQQAQAEQRAQHLKTRDDREAKGREKSAQRAVDAASAPIRAASARQDQAERTAALARASAARAERAVQARQAQGERAQQARAHEEEIRQRQARRTKPAASSLPVPP